MPVSKAQQKAVDKYVKANYDRIEFKAPKGRKAEIQAHAQVQGESVNGFIGRAIAETIERDGSADSQPASPQAPETPQDVLLVLIEVGYDPVAEKPLYTERDTEKRYYVEPVPANDETSDDLPDDIPF